ncbi:YlxR family protein [Candidatus Poribacteria bacterium]|nr:YlxR family protein [Candidatus Poribacteria bacterium]
MKNQNVPIRTCIGCRSKFPQKTLIRFVCSTEKRLQIEELKKLPGRGAYLCKSKECIEKAFKEPKRINTLLHIQLSSSVINEFKQAILDKEVIADG